MTPLPQFVTEWNNKPLDFDGVFGDQCVDLADAWATNLGAPLPPVEYAVDFAGKSIPGYIWVPNSPTNQPKPGDIVIFGVGVGAPGHVDLAFENITVRDYDGFDENWPLGSVCHVQHHDYTTGPVLGWHHPHVLDPQPAPAPAPAPAPQPGGWGSAVHWRAFSGYVMGRPSVNVRTGPGTGYPVIYTTPYGMKHNFDAWVAWGPGIPDAVTGHFDNRWFHISSDPRKGWVASAEIYGNP